MLYVDSVGGERLVYVSVMMSVQARFGDPSRVVWGRQPPQGSGIGGTDNLRLDLQVPSLVVPMSRFRVVLL